MPSNSGHDVTMKQSQDRLEKMKQYVTVGMQTCGLVATDVIDNEKDEIGKEKLAEVEDTMLEFCKMHQDVLDITKALRKVHEEAQNLEEDDPVDLEDLLNKRLHEIKEKSKKKQLTEHEEYLKFKDTIQEQMNNADGTTPPDSDSVEAEDEDVEISQADVVTKCPITGKDMVNPVKNTKCGHRYDREGILNHIKQRKGKAKCPIGGCPNQEFLQEDDLVEDIQLRTFIQRKARGGKRTK